MKITVYQNHESNDQIRPVWIAIDFEMDGVPWSQNALYIDVSAYDIRNIYDFMDDVIGCSVYLEELFSDPDGKELGINLERINKRIGNTGMDLTLIERFIVQVCDVQEVLESAREMFL